MGQVVTPECRGILDHDYNIFYPEGLRRYLDHQCRVTGDSKPGYQPSSPEKETEVICAEFAVANFLDVQYRATARKKDIDVAGIVDVKSTTCQTWDDHKPTLFMTKEQTLVSPITGDDVRLVLVSMSYDVEWPYKMKAFLFGWILAKDARREDWWGRKNENNAMTYNVPRWALRPMSELRTWFDSVRHIYELISPDVQMNREYNPTKWAPMFPKPLTTTVFEKVVD